MNKNLAAKNQLTEATHRVLDKMFAVQSLAPVVATVAAALFAATTVAAPLFAATTVAALFAATTVAALFAATSAVAVAFAALPLVLMKWWTVDFRYFKASSRNKVNM